MNDSEDRYRTQLSRDRAESQAFINAVREVLGLEVLYGAKARPRTVERFYTGETVSRPDGMVRRVKVA